MLCLALFVGQAQAAENWVQVRTPHFVVTTNAGEKQGRHIASQFEQMRWVFHTLFPKAVVDPPAPIVILAVKNQKDFQTLEPEAYLAKGQLQLAGFFLRGPDKNYILVRLDASGEHPFSTVYHEYTHLLNSKAEAWMPIWLDEGLAEFFQNTEIGNKQVTLGEPSADDILFLRQNSTIPLPVLLKVDHESPYYHQEQKGSVFYAESWALTHYLEINDFTAHTHRLSDYSELVRGGEDSVTAAAKAFGDLKQLQNALYGYIHQGSYQQFVMHNSSGSVDENTFTAVPLSANAADAVRADFLAYDGRAKDAETLLEHILSEDPKNGPAHETMGYLQFRRGDLKAARDAYEQAVQLDSQSYLAHYYYAAITIQQGKVDHPEQVEASLRASIKLNPQFAPAYDSLATFYAARQEKLEDAHLLELQAIALEPENFNYRLNTALILEEQQKYSNAEHVLNAALPLAKSAAETSAVQMRLKNLQDYEAAAAQSQSSAAPASSVATQAVALSHPAGDAAPRHPTETPHGPTLTAKGVIREVQCSGAAAFELKVKGQSSPVSVYTNNYFKLDFRAANFTPKGEIHPCSDLDGMRAEVKYFATADKTSDGQIVSIELWK